MKASFWKEIGPKKPGLEKFIKSQPVYDWLKLMADIRHLAAHGNLPTPTKLLKDTEESKASE